jgi:hypothetical protein
MLIWLGSLCDSDKNSNCHGIRFDLASRLKKGQLLMGPIRFSRAVHVILRRFSLSGFNETFFSYDS